MTYQNKFLKTFVACSAAGALLAMSPLLCRAEDEISVEQIRRELRQAAGTSTGQQEATTIGKDFALSDRDVETENARLEAQEAALLKKLSSPEAQALIKDVADGKSEPLPTAASITRSGREVAASAAAAAATARAEVQNSEQAVDEIDNAPLVRAARKVDDAEFAPKGSLKSATSSQIITAPAGSVKTAAVKTESKSQKADVDAREASLKSLNAQVATLRRTNSDLSAKLQKSDLQIGDLSKQLEAAKNRLMLAETEVERLAGSIDARNRSAALKFSGTVTNVSGQQNSGVIAPAAQRTQSKASDDTPVATVVAEKANLRTGPGAENSPLMSVTRGTRLVVETKQGDWYRVISPTGTRAWVSSDVVAFGPNSQSSPTRTVRIKGYDSSLEGDNFNIAKSAQ